MNDYSRLIIENDKIINECDIAINNLKQEIKVLDDKVKNNEKAEEEDLQKVKLVRAIEFYEQKMTSRKKKDILACLVAPTITVGATGLFLTLGGMTLLVPGAILLTTVSAIVTAAV